MDLHNATASLRERERVPDGFGLAGNVRARFQVHFNVVTVYIIVVVMVTNELMSWFRRFSNMNTTSCMEGLDPCETTTTVPVPGAPYLIAACARYWRENNQRAQYIHVR